MTAQKPIIFALFLLLWPGIVKAWTLDGVGDFSFQPLADKVHVMHGPLSAPSKKNHGFMNNPGFVESANGVIIIDPGSTLEVGRKILAEIAKLTSKPVLAVFNTHVHGDHWLANHAIKEAFPDARIYGLDKMIERAKGDAGHNWLQSMERMTEGLSRGTRIVAPENAVKNGMTIEIDGEKFKIHHLGTAHTNTDIMVEHVGSKTLFLGDNDFLGRFGQFDESSDIHGNIKTLQYAIDLKMDNYVPGHGKSGSAKAAVKPFLDYLLLLKKAVTAGYRADKEPHEIKKEIAGQFAAYRDWSGFDFNFGRHISKIYLEIEALEF